MYFASDILKVFPHKYPFLLIDRIIEHNLGQHCTALKNISLGEEIFSGHFPSAPIYPGAYLIEMAFQSSLAMMLDFEMLLSISNQEKMTLDKDFAPRALQVKKFSFKKEVSPGDQLLIKAEKQIEAQGKVQVKVSIFEADNKEEVADGLVIVGKV